MRKNIYYFVDNVFFIHKQFYIHNKSVIQNLKFFSSHTNDVSESIALVSQLYNKTFLPSIVFIFKLLYEYLS